jgi:hypothetical protein
MITSAYHICKNFDEFSLPHQSMLLVEVSNHEWLPTIAHTAVIGVTGSTAQ